MTMGFRITLSHKKFAYSKIKHLLLPKAAFLLFISLCLYYTASAQKYNFIHYSVADGLAQSQPFAFAQNASHELFIGTLGGLSEFDGSHFTNFNKGNGMPHNIVYSIAIDQKQNVWLATPNGISKFDGRTFKNYTITSKLKDENSTTEVVVDGQNTVWALASNHLYRFQNNQFIPEDENNKTLCMTVDKSGKLWVFKYPEGLFVKDEKGWHKEINTRDDRLLAIYKMSFGNFSGTLYCITSEGLKIAEKGTLITPEWLKTIPSKAFIHAILEDSKGNKWLAGEDGGVWVSRQNKWIRFDYSNGFSNETVNVFFEDAEKNIWLGTNGAGIFLFSGNTFTYYDRSSGFFSPNIMSITQDFDKNLFFAGGNNELFKMKAGKMAPVKVPKGLSKINTLLTDSSGTMWLGTANGLWIYKNGRFSRFESRQAIFGVIHLYENNQAIWVSALNGLFSIKNNVVHRENVFHTVYATIALGQDTLMLGTINGVYIFHRETETVDEHTFLPDATVLCFAEDKKYLYVGTDDRGVVFWNRQTRKFTKINQDSGLSCNYVYSLLKDKSGNLWVGTGCGIDEISFSPNSIKIKNFDQSDGLRGLENNANASFEDADGYIWFGTNRGLFKYNPYVNAQKNNAQKPKVIFQSVKLFSKEVIPGAFSDSLLPFSNIPYDPVFPSGANHLTFTFKGICLSSPNKIKYRYQLIGIDKQITETNQNTVIYPNLPPGHYIFKVWASDANGNWSNNSIEYPFTISTPFYKTFIFKAGLALLIIVLVSGAVYYRNNRKAARMRWAAAMREEEQARVRKKTAEDFHDEIGNKLTRISLLATVMESKTKNAMPEVKQILQQIKKNVESLYRGSKDIIWSLQPESDFLDEIIWKIRQNTEEMLQDSGIDFTFKQTGDWPAHLKMPPEYSRNLIMIFKEAINNMVKHSGAQQVQLTLKKEEDQILFLLKDDGKGFDPAGISEGNGLQNMKSRAERLRGKLIVKSEAGKGTELQLHLELKTT